MDSQRMFRYLALGDSYTIGEGVEESERWPVQLVTKLRAEGIRLAFPEIIAVTGWTTDELAAGINEAEPVGRFDLVSLSIGVNNQYRERSLEQYQQQFRDLLNQSIAFAGGMASRVLVLSIPDWSVTPFANGRDLAAIAQEIDAFNLAKKLETQLMGAAYVDITPLSRSQAGMVVADGLHPDADAYATWAALAEPVVRAMLISEQDQP